MKNYFPDDPEKQEMLKTLLNWWSLLSASLQCVSCSDKCLVYPCMLMRGVIMIEQITQSSIDSIMEDRASAIDVPQNNEKSQNEF